MPVSNAHYPALDGVRGIAILMVFGAHTNPKLLLGGVIGVDLFFVLSGFLITTILLSEYACAGSINFKNFYARRALRLFPALFAMVGLFTFYFALKHSDQFAMMASNAQAIVLYYWNWVLVLHYGEPGWTYVWFFGHLWSLSVEEQFYIAWPFVISALLMLPRRAFPAVLIVGIVGSAVARLLLWDDQHIFNLYFRTDLHSDGLLWGALGAWIVASGWRPDVQARKLSIAGAAAMVLFVAASYFELFWSGIAFRGGWTVLDGLAMLAIVSLVIAPSPFMQRILSSLPLSWTGKISYSLYIWHLPVFYYCHQVVPFGEPWQSITAISISYVIGAMSFYCWERYFLRLKKHFVTECHEQGSVPAVDSTSVHIA
jgi:peptidoglycan/LPS O-acetylase OafA/YrhL